MAAIPRMFPDGRRRAHGALTPFARFSISCPLFGLIPPFPVGSPGNGPMKQCGALAARHGDGVIPRVQEAITDEVERPGAGRLLGQLQFHPVIARESLILSDTEGIEVMRIEFLDRAAHA